MKRTQVYFPEKTLELIKKEAKERNATMAAIIREKIGNSAKTKATKLSQHEINEKLKLIDEISKLNFPTMPPGRMKKIFSEAHDPHL